MRFCDSRGMLVFRNSQGRPAGRRPVSLAERIAPALLLVFVCVLAACSDESSSAPPCSTLEFSGISETDADGTVRTVDPDDWRCSDDMILCPAPAFPNPIRNGVWLRFTLSEPQRVSISVINRCDEIVAGPLDGSELTAGSHDVLLLAAGWPEGDYRVVIRATDNQGEVRESFGDLLKS